MKRRWAVFFLILGISTLLGLLFAAQLYVIYSQSKRDVVWSQILESAMPFWYLWALLVPVIAYLARRVPLDRSHALRAAAVHIPAAALVSALHQALYILQGCVWSRHERPCHFFVSFSENVFSFYFMVGVIVYFAVLLGTQAVDFARRFRDSQLHASRLESELAKARLRALRAQLQPHFLFNTLHAISALVVKDPEAADRMIADLSDLLRLALEDVEQDEVTVRRELELVERYLSIERMRFADRLTVRLSIGPETLDARVPSLILQPLVENAMRHGASRREGPSWIEIRSGSENGRLSLGVRDGGEEPAPSAAPPLREGIGFRAMRARLEELYAGEHSFEYGAGTDGVFSVRVTIPMRLAG
jgi:two-component system, LytTR family, sensor kinase